MVKAAARVDIREAPDSAVLGKRNPVTRAALEAISPGNAPKSRLDGVVDWGKGRVKWFMDLDMQKKMLVALPFLIAAVIGGIYVWDKLQPIIALVNCEREKTLLILLGMGHDFLVWANS